MTAQNEEGEEVGLGPLRLPDYLRPTYANYASVTHTPWDFRITFGVIKSPNEGELPKGVKQIHPEAVADVILPANLIQGFIQALEQNLAKYLDSFGPPGRPDDPLKGGRS